MTEGVTSDTATGIVRLQGDLTIQRANDLREQLIAASMNASRLSIDCRGVTGIDLCTVQLLLACGKHHSKSVAVRIVDTPQGIVAQELGRAGIAPDPGWLEPTQADNDEEESRACRK